MAAGLIGKLRAETRTEHVRLEQACPTFDSHLDRRTYTEWIARLYGFVRPLENGLARLPGWDEIGVDLEKRSKTRLLEKDLATLGVHSADLRGLPICTELPDVSTMPRALGCLYVLEGATLGGRFITKRLENLPPDIHGHAMAYHRSHGVEVPTMWRTMGDRIEAFAHNRDIDAEIINAARTCFASLEAWLARKPWPRGSS